MLGADKLRGMKKNRQEMSTRETSPLLGVGVLAQALILGEFQSLKYKTKKYQPMVGSPTLSFPMHLSHSALPHPARVVSCPGDILLPPAPPPPYLIHSHRTQQYLTIELISSWMSKLKPGKRLT